MQMKLNSDSGWIRQVEQFSNVPNMSIEQGHRDMVLGGVAERAASHTRLAIPLLPFSVMLPGCFSGKLCFGRKAPNRSSLHQPGKRC